MKKPVKLYYIPPLTGPWAAVVDPLWKGTTGYIDYINETMCGVSGHKIEYGWADSRYEAARTLTIYNRFKGEGAFFVNIYGSPDGEALKPRAEADKILPPTTGSPTPRCSRQRGTSSGAPPTLMPSWPGWSGRPPTGRGLAP